MFGQNVGQALDRMEFWRPPEPGPKILVLHPPPQGFDLAHVWWARSVGLGEGGRVYFSLKPYSIACLSKFFSQNQLISSEGLFYQVLFLYPLLGDLLVCSHGKYRVFGYKHPPCPPCRLICINELTPLCAIRSSPLVTCNSPVQTTPIASLTMRYSALSSPLKSLIFCKTYVLNLIFSFQFKICKSN
jgi:hypothetical protein